MALWASSSLANTASALPLGLHVLLVLAHGSLGLLVAGEHSLCVAAGSAIRVVLDPDVLTVGHGAKPRRDVVLSRPERQPSQLDHVHTSAEATAAETSSGSSTSAESSVS